MYKTFKIETMNEWLKQLNKQR